MPGQPIDWCAQKIRMAVTAAAVVSVARIIAASARPGELPRAERCADASRIAAPANRIGRGGRVSRAQVSHGPGGWAVARDRVGTGGVTVVEVIPGRPRGPW